ncbi:MAG: M35 family metallo-endopeptidase [Candidatus Methanoperedens sp.]|nr:M35 family metallo-endopeptidase [Candidatus Methanoperedens sp.]
MPADVLQLQHMIGNRAVGRLLSESGLRTSSAGYVQRFTTQDCDPSDKARIEESHNRAIAMLDKAIQRLTSDPVTAETQRHFANHFGDYGSLRRDIVVGHFKRDLSLMKASKITYECESECNPGEPAYTYWIFGDIHICLPWLRSESLNERGETFIHELHHWDAIRGHLDLGYHKNNTDNKTTWIVAVNNADAYSELAQDLYEQP